jgi:hypothetical protein
MTAEAADAQALDNQAPDTQAADAQAGYAQAGDMPASDTLDVDAQDDAVLRMVALEMAAPDPSDIDLPADTAHDEIDITESPPAGPVLVAQPGPTAVPAISPSLQTSLQPSLQPPLQASPEPSPEPSVEPSLGSALIASGLLRKPNASHSDPLAPIRRMSQAEKIAFFS